MLHYASAAGAVEQSYHTLMFIMSFLTQERSGVYERLVECEEAAKGAKRGVHSAKEPAANRINDVSAPGNATK